MSTWSASKISLSEEFVVLSIIPTVCVKHMHVIIIPQSYTLVYILRAELNYIFILGLRLLISNTGEGARQESMKVFYSLHFLKIFLKYSSNEFFISCIRQKGGHTFPNELSVVISFHAAWSPSVKRKYASH